MFSAVPRLSLAVSLGVFMLFAPLSVCLPRSPAAVLKAVRSRSHHHHPRADHNCGARSRTKDRLIKTERAREGERERDLTPQNHHRHAGGSTAPLGNYQQPALSLLTPSLQLVKKEAGIAP